MSSALESNSQNVDEIEKDIAQKSSRKMSFRGSEKSQAMPEAALKACTRQLLECAILSITKYSREGAYT